MDSPLHIHRHRDGPRFRVVLDDAVAAAAWSAVSGTGQRNLRRLRIRLGSLRRLAGPLHALAQFQPAATTLGVAAADRSRRGRHGGYGSAVSCLARRCARPNGCRAPAVVRLPAGRRIVAGRAVHAGRNRPVHPMAVPFSGGTGRSHCAIPSFGGHCGGAARGADHHTAQRCGAQVRDEFHEQHVRCGQQ
ncbi:Uncharacterised protein [Mycobacterium tuberculosis]|uniref:Uncharacterized protein n=1 Tax=Mycobacterium tuberculosis TaxID=1773 RepID=A0A655IAB6_MYCTX|nr:Uncharacterised protein [Mycobacterium tuberculosis]CKS02552.1 Uncharacterised protein [Mycobacterium tuberculosis]CKT17463.1 Uncharacterised protein [Mycobacterium tuberculosis]CNU95421.1 Uncharacterised protein [Mycobacterium tuberculosis]CNV22876.1 Uncharacterised protein [Mycobacterium tuberculosis]